MFRSLLLVTLFSLAFFMVGCGSQPQSTPPPPDLIQKGGPGMDGRISPDAPAPGETVNQTTPPAGTQGGPGAPGQPTETITDQPAGTPPGGAPPAGTPAPDAGS